MSQRGLRSGHRTRGFGDHTYGCTASEAYLEDDFGQTNEEVEERSPYVYGVTDAEVGVPRNWELLVIVQRSGVTDVSVMFEATIR